MKKYRRIVPAALALALLCGLFLLGVAEGRTQWRLLLLVPAAASQVAILVPVSALISIGAARLLYVKGVLQ